jgi:hypothetical protein
VLDTSDVRKRDFDQGQVIGLADEYQMGQSWDDALYGAGSYCHVEPIGEYFGKGLYNLEYWTLFAFNKVESVPSRDHKADVICVQMVYNEYLNWITRISFSIHGNAIVAFDVPTPDEFQKCCGALTAYFEKITGSDGYKIMAGVDSKQRPLTKKVKPWPSKRHYASGPTFLWDGVSFDYPDNYFYFAESEDGTGEGYVHPCVFLENGSHEPWPNETGSYTAVGDHEGGSYCFIPKDISLLFPYKNQENKNEPFMYFGGKFGSSDGPKGLQLHKAWLNPEQNVDLAGRDDMDPYSLGNDMEFPPT